MDTPIIVLLFAVAGTAVIYALVERYRRMQQPSAPPPGDRPVERAGPPWHVADPAAWLLDATRYFRRLEFFADRAVSDEALAEQLGRRIEEEWGATVDQLTEDPQAADMFLVGLDTDRAYRAPSKYFYPGDDTYVGIVQRCAGLAPSVFPVTDVREVWEDDRGPVRVLVAFEGQPREYTVTDPKYFDAGVVTFLNTLAAPAQVALRVCDNHGMPDFVIALRHTDARRLSEDRGWVFWDTLVTN